jgi:hypothetical protein
LTQQVRQLKQQLEGGREAALGVLPEVQRWVGFRVQVWMWLGFRVRDGCWVCM